MSQSSFFKELLGLNDAELLRVEHEDTIMADVYRVLRPSEQPLILKICPRDGDYYREFYFLQYLAGSLAVPRIVARVEPSLDQSGAILMECIPGHLLRPEDWNPSLAFRVGVVMAKLHLNGTEAYGDLTKPESLTPSAFAYFESKFNEELQECVPHLPEAIIKESQAFLYRHRHLLDLPDGPCLVHRDFRPGNLMVQEGRLTGVIDWAGARSGFAAQDFCSMELHGWPIKPQDKESLLAGYASVRPVPDYHPLMPLLRLGRALAVIGFTVKSGTWRGTNSRLYEFHRRALEHFDFDLSH